MKRYKLSERKLELARYYFSEESETHYNYYRSGLKAGFSDSYSRKISAMMGWAELALLAEKQGLALLDKSSKEYAEKICGKISESVSK